MLPRLFRPHIFQGSLRRRRYFEGWYLKHVSEDPRNVVSLIPGIALSPGDRHAFVQYIELADGTDVKSGYVRYPLDQFHWDRYDFDITIGPNRFSRKGIRLDLRDGTRTFSGAVDYTDMTGFPSRPTAPGIMGWYTFVPFMECNHGVVSINHRVTGTLKVDGNEHIFSRGSGYIEKDWGGSFPESWLWLQCNSFPEDDVSVMVSVAKIPWLGRHFLGFLGFIYVNKRLYLFATYNKSTISRFSVSDNEASLTMTGRAGVMRIHVARTGVAALEAPTAGEMARSIRESIDGTAEVVLEDPGGTVIYQGTGNSAGLEVEGDIAGEARNAGFTRSE